MDGKKGLTKQEAMMFFNRAWEFLASLPSDRGLELRSYAEDRGIDLDEAMKYVIEAAEKGYHAGGHTACTKRNVLRVYRPGELLDLDGDHINGMATLLTIDLGLQDDY